MLRDETNAENDAVIMGLQALGWVLSDDRRAERLLAVTGLDAGTLRAQAGQPAMLRAILLFLEDHEPDLLACASGIGTTPEALVAARRALAA